MFTSYCNNSALLFIWTQINQVSWCLAFTNMRLIIGCNAGRLWLFQSRLFVRLKVAKSRLVDFIAQSKNILVRICNTCTCTVHVLYTLYIIRKCTVHVHVHVSVHVHQGRLVCRALPFYFRVAKVTFPRAWLLKPVSRTYMCCNWNCLYNTDPGSHLATLTCHGCFQSK